jgi:hypothetical protein
MCRALFFIGTASWRIVPVRVRDALLACVLEHLVTFRDGVGQPGAVLFEMGIAHQVMAQVKQVPVAQSEFLAHAVGAFPFEEAAEYRHDRTARPVGPLELGGRENIEECPAAVAAVLDNGFPLVFMGMVVMASATGAGQSAIVKEIDEPVIAFLLVHQVVDRKYHGRWFYNKDTESAIGEHERKFQGGYFFDSFS